jgi:hypothetical protein
LDETPTNAWNEGRAIREANAVVARQAEASYYQRTTGPSLRASVRILIRSSSV